MNNLLEHFKRMQEMAARYLEPGPYTDRDGVVWSDGAPEGFVGDVIYMLDGPKQREAQAEATDKHQSPTTGVLIEALKAARDFIAAENHETGYCMCGSKVDGHSIGDGHSPVDEGSYCAAGILWRIEEALSRPSPIAEHALALLKRFANSPAYGASAGEAHCQMTVERALIEEAQALIAESGGER